VTLAYLDHAATTPMRPEAVEAMLPFLTEQYANPSGSHRAARQARAAVDEARDVVATALGCDAGEVVFTGCGTESDNTAIRGVLNHRGGVAVCPAAEHHAVLHVVEAAGGRVVGTDRLARVRPDELVAALEPDPARGPVTVVSVMAVNNEVGAVQPLGPVAELVRRGARGAVLHTDAVQAPCWLDLREITPSVDLLALSGHKFGGPKGVGVLMVRRGTVLAPLLEGGGQERDRRSGTHNVAGIVAFAEALRITDERRGEEVARIGALRDALVDGLLDRVPDVLETVPREHKVAGSAHVCIAGVESEALLYLLDEEGVCASAASACAAGAMEPSHVLAAMGVDRSWSRGALRLTLGFASTADDVDRALDVIPPAVGRLRRGRRS
jgi:cysteine desulfurase